MDSIMSKDERMNNPASKDAPLITNGEDIIGNVEFKDGIVSGWVKDKNRGNPLEIMISIDDVLLWDGPARRTIAATPNKSQAPVGPFGFRILIPDPAGSSQITEQFVRVTLRDGGDVPGSPLHAKYGGHLIGYVEAIRFQDEAIVVEGWCIDKRYPSESVPLVLYYGEQLVSRSQTNISRADLSATGYDAPTGGFAIKVHRPSDFNYELLRICPGRSAIPLSLTEDAVLPHHRPADEEIEKAAAFYGLDDDVIEGTIDAIDRRFIRGWARNATNPHAMVFLDCFIDGRLYSTTAANGFRSDLAKNFKDQGFHEYRFELTPAILRSLPGNVYITPRLGKSSINHKFNTLPRLLTPNRVIAPRKPEVMLLYRLADVPPTTTNVSAAMVVVNRNGSGLLESLFSSFYEHNTYKNYEFLVVDHGSTDDSKRIVNNWSEVINIRWLARNGNFSFSSSNNYAASRASADVLVFINNDVTFTSDILLEFLRYMSITSIGCLGLRLLDDCPVKREDGQIAVQHLGVHVDDRNTGLPLLPVETRWSISMQGTEHDAIDVPAVTAAFMACRREEFAELGGFSELYFYGQEDIDLCFKFASHGKRIVSANQLSALHLRGFTRGKMDQRFARA
jgi:GT2 family glycosyltransferase